MKAAMWIGAWFAVSPLLGWFIGSFIYHGQGELRMQQITDYQQHRKSLAEQLKERCKCNHERAKHAHAAGFCQGLNPGYMPCNCDRFELAEPQKLA